MINTLALEVEVSESGENRFYSVTTNSEQREELHFHCAEVVGHVTSELKEGPPGKTGVITGGSLTPPSGHWYECPAHGTHPPLSVTEPAGSSNAWSAQSRG